MSLVRRDSLACFLAAACADLEARARAVCAPDFAAVLQRARRIDPSLTARPGPRETRSRPLPK